MNSRKDFFLIFFNLPENQNVILGKLPNQKFYDPDSMSKERRSKFLMWYNENENNSFDFAKEIHEYCLSDVKILMEGCMKFRHLVMSVTGEELLELNSNEMIFERKTYNAINPFSFLTIASVCLGIYRSNFLTEKWKILIMQEHNKNSKCFHEWNCKCKCLEGRRLNAKSPIQVLLNGVWNNVDEIKIKKAAFVNSPLALIPPHRYNKLDNHSLESLQWLAIVEKHYNESGINIEIQHARSLQGEKVVKYVTENGNIIKYKLDGFFELDNMKYACEFNGCNWHGCPKCFIRDRESILNNGKSLGQRYRETLLKEK